MISIKAWDISHAASLINGYQSEGYVLIFSEKNHFELYKTSESSLIVIEY